MGVHRTLATNDFFYLRTVYWFKRVFSKYALSDRLAVNIMYSVYCDAIDEGKSWDKVELFVAGGI